MRLAVLFYLIPCIAFSQPSDVMSDAITTLETGVICPPPTVGTIAAPGTVAGTTHIIEGDPPFVSLSNKVPAVIGIGFGIKAMSSDFLGLEGVDMTVTHPPMGAGAATSQTFQTRINGNQSSLTFYQFDFDYELLIGTWTMTARKDGTELYRTTFEVVSPKLVPELASICGFENLLS